MSNNELLLSISNMMDEKLLLQKDEMADMTDSKLLRQKDEMADMMDSKLLRQKDEMADMMDSKLLPLEAESKKLNAKIDTFWERTDHRFKSIELLLENEIVPTLKLIVENCVPASLRYETATNKINDIEKDVTLLKKVVSEHSKILNETA